MKLWKTNKELKEKILELEKQIKFLEEMIGDYETGKKRLQEENSRLKKQVKDLEKRNQENLIEVQESVRTMFD